MIKIPVEPPITKYLHNKAAKLHIPLNGTFELTPLCNMDCKMCYIKMNKEKQEAIRTLRTADEWISLADEMKAQGMVYLLLTGGEPFLHPEFKEILQGLHKKGLIISINSNGTLIDEHVIEWLKETPPVRINITLYGASNETYKELCGNSNGFSEVVRAIHLLKEAGISIKLNCSVTPYNMMDLEKIFEFAKKEQLIIQATSYMFPPIRKDASLYGNNNRFSPEDAAYYSAKIVSLLNGEKKFADYMESAELKNYQIETSEECIYSEGEEIRCRAGKCSFWVNWDGKITSCGMLVDQVVGDVFQMGFETAWKQIVEKTEMIRLPAKCKECVLKENCKSCAAMVYAECGNYQDAPVYRCHMSQAYPSACERVLKEIKKRGF